MGWARVELTRTMQWVDAGPSSIKGKYETPRELSLDLPSCSYMPLLSKELLAGH